MTRRISLFFIILTIILAGSALGEDIPVSEPDRLTVGNTTQMRGEFFLDAWGNATSDLDVRDLLHGYNLIRWNNTDGVFEYDSSVVSGMVAMENEQHDHSYTLVLQNDLYYSDGTPITAWDYAFSFLLRIAPELEQLGGKPDRAGFLAGYDAYRSGQSASLAGVHVLRDDSLTITISHDYLPFFYELGLLQCVPYPIHVIAPGVAVRDDGEGVYLANADGSAGSIFTADLLQETICDPDHGYRSHPSVVSGPYTLTSWDGTTAAFEANPFFKGDSDGNKPSIPYLTYTLADNDTMMAALQDGSFDLLNKVTNASAIQQGMGLVSSGDARWTTYPRVGLSYISFCCERDTVSDVFVRQAIAWCLDRDGLTTEITGNYGIRTDGYYGIGQWMYGLLSGTIAPPVNEPENENDTAAVTDYETKLAAWDELTLDNLTAYIADTNVAARLLDDNGWILNTQGLREKEINGNTVVLDLKMIYPAGSALAEAFETYLVPNLAQVGIRLTMEPVEMPRLLNMYYRQEERDTDMICLASNFDLLFDPASLYVEVNGSHIWYDTGCDDEELYSLALDMRQTEPGDLLSYTQKWVAFQQHFNEVLPMLPLYTNVYFDFYTPSLQNYVISNSSTWSKAIIGAYLAVETEENEAGSDEPVFEP